MRKYRLDKLNLTKLYYYSFVSLILYCFIIILLMVLINNIYPKILNVKGVFIITAIIYGMFIYKIIYKRSVQEVVIRVNNKKVSIDNLEIPYDELHEIQFKNKLFSHYPKVKILYGNHQEYSFRITKYGKDFFEFEGAIMNIMQNNKNTLNR